MSNAKLGSCVRHVRWLARPRHSARQVVFLSFDPLLAGDIVASLAGACKRAGALLRMGHQRRIALLRRFGKLDMR